MLLKFRGLKVLHTWTQKGLPGMQTFEIMPLLLFFRSCLEIQKYKHISLMWLRTAGCHGLLNEWHCKHLRSLLDLHET